MLRKHEELRIAVIGLGYVGLPLAVAFEKKYPVVGFDTNSERIKQLQACHDSTLEVSSADLEAATTLTFSAEPESIRDCNFYIVTVPTPIDAVNRPDLTPLRSASKMIGQVLSVGDVVVYESTVYPGCTEEVCVPVLEAESGLVFNRDFFCGYSPERINPADKVNTLATIKKVTSGSTPEAAQFVDAVYKKIIDAGTHLAPSIKVAEAAKVIENTQRDLNIALVNELAVLFERLDIDTMDVLAAAESKWNFLPFRPGLVGGHCIGVDPYYLTHKAEEVGYHPQVILAGRRMNDNMGRYFAQRVVKKMVNNGINIVGSRVAVLGITFKENCPDIRNSKAVDVVSELRAWGVEPLVSDPFADPAILRSEYGIELTPYSELSDLDAAIVAVGHTDYRALAARDFVKITRDKGLPVVGDLKSVFDRYAFAAEGLSIVRL